MKKVGEKLGGFTDNYLICNSKTNRKKNANNIRIFRNHYCIEVS